VNKVSFIIVKTKPMSRGYFEICYEIAYLPTWQDDSFSKQNDNAPGVSGALSWDKS
jgi:hypothetical protein